MSCLYFSVSSSAFTTVTAGLISISNATPRYAPHFLLNSGVSLVFSDFNWSSRMSE